MIWINIQQKIIIDGTNNFNPIIFVLLVMNSVMKILANATIYIFMIDYDHF